LEAPGERRPAPPAKWEFCVFDLSIGKLLVLAVIALVVFGPDQLPKMAKQVGSTLRELRRLAEGARADLREGLGPEFADFEITDLNPKNFVKRQFFDTLDGDAGGSVRQPNGDGANGARTLPAGERPPYDAEAT
jgi:sec-independent protein translocase protein TatB